MTQPESCHHVQPEGSYCGSPALRDRKYCYYHLMERARRLRRARALRDNQPYRLEIQSLDNPYAIRAAISDVAQALAAGQLDPRVAGKLLYAFQLASSNNRRIEKMEAEAAKNGAKEAVPQVGKEAVPQVGKEAVPQVGKEAVPQVRARLLGANLGPQTDDASRLQEFPDFDETLGLPPGADLDAEVAAAEQKADEEAEIRRAHSLPEPPPGIRPGSPAYRLFREETYQMMRYQINDLRHQLRDYHEQKRQQNQKEIETMKKEAMSATPAPDRRADTA
jgi:hypothetical protein